MGLLLTLLVFPAFAAHSFVLFDVAGATLTQGEAINANGEVAGIYEDSSYVVHGFLREPNGAITTFDVANETVTSLTVTGINSSGQVSGWYYQPSQSVEHGFLRDANGTITVIDASPVGAKNTFVTGLNDLGAMTGYYQLNSIYYGFVRDAQGVFTSFSAQSSPGTYPAGINVSGQVAGTYSGKRRNYGFVRDQFGKVTTFNPVGSQNMLTTGINQKGQVLGWYIDNITSVYHGFLRNSDGTIIVIDVPGTGQNANTGPMPLSINDKGQIAGYSVLSPYVYQSFVRDQGGNVVTFAAPNAESGSTQAVSINAAGTITGYYRDAQHITTHGFIRY